MAAGDGSGLGHVYGSLVPRIALPTTGPQGSTPFLFCLREPVGKTTLAVWPCRFAPPPDVGGSLG